MEEETMKKKRAAQRSSKKAKKPIRDLQALDPKSRRVVGGGRALRGRLGKRI
jgi:hypothetical protein